VQNHTVIYSSIDINCCVLLSYRTAARMNRKWTFERHEQLLTLVSVLLVVVGGLVVALALLYAVWCSSSQDTTSLSLPLSPSLYPCLSSSSSCSSSSSSSLAAVSTTTASPSTGDHGSVYKRYRFAAVTTDTNICSQIGVLEHSLFSELS